MTRPYKSPPGLNRRQLLRAALAGGSAATGLLSSRVWSSSTHQPYEGPLLVTLQLNGGVDVTQLCDPKVNVKASPKLTTGRMQLTPVRLAVYAMRPWPIMPPFSSVSVATHW